MDTTRDMQVERTEEERLKRVRTALALNARLSRICSKGWATRPLRRVLNDVRAFLPDLYEEYATLVIDGYVPGCGAPLHADNEEVQVDAMMGALKAFIETELGLTDDCAFYALESEVSNARGLGILEVTFEDGVEDEDGGIWDHVLCYGGWPVEHLFGEHEYIAGVRRS